MLALGMTGTLSGEILIWGIQSEIFLTWNSAQGWSGENGSLNGFEFLTFESGIESVLGLIETSTLTQRLWEEEKESDYASSLLNFLKKVDGKNLNF